MNDKTYIEGTKLFPLRLQEFNDKAIWNEFPVEALRYKTSDDQSTRSN